MEEGFNKEESSPGLFISTLAKKVKNADGKLHILIQSEIRKKQDGDLSSNKIAETMNAESVGLSSAGCEVDASKKVVGLEQPNDCEDANAFDSKVSSKDNASTVQQPSVSAEKVANVAKEVVNVTLTDGACESGSEDVTSNKGLNPVGNYKKVTFADVAAPSKEKKTVNFRKLDSLVGPGDDFDVMIPISSVKEVSDRLRNTLYGYFIGKRIAFPVVENYVYNTWAKYGIRKVMMNARGFYFFKFDSQKGVEDVLENGPWMVSKVPIILNKWTPSVSLTKENHKTDPVWVKLHDVPIASKVGKPLMLDTYTSFDGLNASEPSRSKAETSLDVSVPPSDVGSVLRQPSSSPLAESSIESPPVALSPTLSRKLSDLKSPTGGHESSEPKTIEYSADRQVDSVPDESKVSKEDGPKFKHPTHLVTPAELMATSSSEINHVSEVKNDIDSNLHDATSNSDSQNVELEVKVVGETGKIQNVETVLQSEVHGFASQASDFGSRVVSGETFIVNESKQLDGLSQTLSGQDVAQDAKVDVSGQVEPATSVTVDSPTPASTKGRKHKVKNVQGSNPSSPSPIVFNSTDSSIEPVVGSSVPSAESILSQLHSMQEVITQVLINQKEIQKQIPGMLAVPVTKEGKRVEAAIGKTMEKTYKANSDALWVRTQEEFTKQEKSNRDRHQQVSGLVTNGYKDLLAAWEKMLKKETSALVPAVVRSVTPIIEKTVSSAISEAFQRGVADKSVNQLEKSVSSKLEASVARQIQTQFQTSGKQALQEALRSSMEASVVPAFEMSCKAMFDQVDATFQKGMIEHTSSAQQQVESAHSPLAIALRDAINSASSMTQTLSGELADGQRKLVALALSGANTESLNPLMTQRSNGPIGSFHEIEAPLDPTKELSRLVYEHKYGEAFTAALQRSDVGIVSWLCSQVDLQGLLTRNPVPLSQGVLLSLLQQLACDIGNDTGKKLQWMMDVVVAIKPSDSMISMHVRPIYEQVYSILNHQMGIPTTSVSELSSIRILMQLVNSTLRTL